MPISRVEMLNFGPYPQASFELGPGLTVVRGPNLSGKSWIMRALQWALLNDGQDYAGLAHEPGPAAEVAVTFDDGTKVTRRRTKTVNELLLDVPGQPPRALSPGKGPNETVLDQIGLGLAALSEGWSPVLQFSNEHDAPFLLSEPYKRQESALARAVGSDVLELASSLLASTQTSLTRDHNAATSEVNKLSAEIEHYAALDEAKELVEESDRLLVAIEAQQAKINEHSELEVRTEAARAAVARWPGEIPIPDIEAWRGLQGKAEAEALLVSSWVDCKAAVSRLSAISRVEVPSSPPDAVDDSLVAAWCQAKASKTSVWLEQLQPLMLGLDAAYDQSSVPGIDIGRAYLATTTGLEAETKNMAEAAAELEALWEEAGVCPLCGKEVGQCSDSWL